MYKWVALTNTTVAVFMSALDNSIVIVSLPAIFRGIDLDPLAPGNVGYLLWMIMGYQLVQAIFVLTLGRLGDMFGRVRIYKPGFAVFTIASLLLSFDPFEGPAGALWLIGWRMVQAFGGSMLAANSAAILTDAFPRNERGFALGVNRIAGLAGQFLGLIAGGFLTIVHWQAIFLVNVPVGVFGTVWAYRTLRETSSGKRAPIDWLGNLTFVAGLGAILVGITTGIQPYGTRTMGWTNPAIDSLLAGGALLLALFAFVETRVGAPMFRLNLFRIRAFAAGNAASLAAAVACGGMQFTLLIWLQGIWLPLHGYNYEDTPLWAGVCMLPLSIGFVIAGPVSGRFSDRFGSRGFTTAGALLLGASFVALLSLPMNFTYPTFGAAIFAAGIGVGMFGAPNTAAIMSSVPADQRGAASGMRSTFQHAGVSLSVGLFFSLTIAGLTASLPHTLAAGLARQGVPQAAAQKIASLPPVASLFAAFLGANPVRELLVPNGVAAALPPANRRALVGLDFFPNLISAPFHHELVAAFTLAAVLSLFAAIASYSRGSRPEMTAQEPLGD